MRIEIGPGIPRSPWSPWPFGPRPQAKPDGPRLGVLVGEMTPALRSHLSLTPHEGLLVDEVLPGSHAERLGLRRYDVVIRVGDVSVGSAKDVRMALAKLPKDTPVTVRIIRGAKRMDLVAGK